MPDGNAPSVSRGTIAGRHAAELRTVTAQPGPGLRIIVCGGRNYRDKSKVFAALDRLHAACGIDCVIQGGADGADDLALQWAAGRGVCCVAVMAQWDKHGRVAGPLRNQEMIDRGRPDGVVVVPGGRGTADMVRRAEAAGLTVWRPPA
jgi:predicted Rossmann-fold nucleotide-binding protein